MTSSSGSISYERKNINRYIRKSKIPSSGIYIMRCRVLAWMKKKQNVKFW